MMASRLLMGISLTAALLAWGCSAQIGTSSGNEVVAGRAFDYQRIPGLQLGQTTPSQAQSQFGEPKAERTVSNDFNDYRVLQYIWVKVDGYSGKESFRVLTLEFVDETLNGYLYGTTFPDDLGFRNPDGSKQVIRQKSTPAEVKQAMGEPDGKAYYTTTLTAFAEGSGEEIWVWQEGGTGEDGVTEKRVLVGFDRDGIVDNVTTSTTKIN